jgi:hypothetical protein
VSRTRTLTNMLLDVRQRTNQENSTFVTDAELTEYLNQELAELWSLLVLNEGQPHYRASASYVVTAGTPIQPLPADFWAAQEVTGTFGGETYQLQPFMAAEHGSLMSPNVFAAGCAFYRIQAGNIEFRPASSFTATLYYAPVQPRLVNPGDPFDGFNGYEVAAIYGVCATVLAKEESDPRFYQGQKDRILAQIAKAAQHRDMSNPERVSETIPRDDVDVGNRIYPRWGI